MLGEKNPILKYSW